MRLKSLLTTFLLLAGFSTAKAVTVGIGTSYGTGSDQWQIGMPSRGNYSMLRQLYTANEIGRAGYIASITFFVGFSDPSTTIRYYDIYLKHTSATYFGVTVDDSVADSDLVFSGYHIIISGGWTTIALDTPFLYNGTDNLIIVIDDNKGGYVEMKSAAFPTSGLQAYSYYSTSGNFDVNEPYESKITYDKKMQLKLEMYDADQVDDGQCLVGKGPDVYQDFLPTTSFYKYSITQQIYTADEISSTGEARLINSISLYNAGREKTRKISLWFFPTHKSSFDTFGDWIELPSSEPLFEGEVTFYEDNWTVIPLSRPVLSNGTDNFVLCVNDETGSFQYGGQLSFLSYETTESQQMNMYGDTQPFRPANIKSYNGYYDNKVKNKLIFNNESDLSLIPRPTDINVEAQPTSATVTWSALLVQAFTYQLSYKADTETEWHQVSVENGYVQRYELTGLTPNTKYRVRVRVNHNGDTSHWTSAEFTTPDFVPTDIAVTTTSTTATISWTGYSDSYDVMYRELSTEPIFFDDFEHGLEYKGWTVSPPRKEGQGWFTENVTLRSSEGATYTNHSGSNCAVSESWSSSIGGINANNCLYTPVVDLGGTLKFWQWVSSSYPDSYEVLISGIESLQFIPLRPLAPGIPGWNEVVIDLSAYQGQKGVIAIVHSCTDKMWLFIDDFAIYSAGEWQTVTTTEQQVTLTDLKPNTKYEYKIVGHQSVAAAASTDILNFKTPEWQPVLTDIAVVPDATSAAVSWTGNSESYEVEYREAATGDVTFFDDFENGLADKGWKVYTQGETSGGEGWFTQNMVDRSAGEKNHSGSNCVFAESWTNVTNGLAADNWLVTPQVSLGGTLKFWQWIRGDYPDSFEVLLSTTGNAIEDFTTTLRPLGPGEDRWNEVVIDLSAYEGQQGYIAIHHKCTDMFWMGIDDFGIYPLEQEWAKVTTTEQTVTLTNLKPNTTYEYKIVAYQSGTETISSDILTFMTLDGQSALTDIAIVSKATSAAVSWTGNSECYRVEYRPVASGDEGSEEIFSDDFESGNLDKWTLLIEGETPDTGLGWHAEAAPHPHQGEYVASSWSWYPGPGGSGSGVAIDADNWLITPQVTLKGELKYWVRSSDTDPNYADSYEVRLSTTGNAVSDFTTELVPLQEVPGEWQEVVIDLSTYNGQLGYIAIRHKTKDRYRLLLDDFAIYETSAASGEWMSQETTETSLTLNDLLPETTYELRITGITGGEVDIVSDIVSFTTKVLRPIDLVLDNNNDNFETIKTVDGTWANVTINNLTLKKDGKWQTILLPFDVDVESSPLAGADVRTLESLTITNRIGMLDCLTPQTTMEANKPYIIRWDEGEDIENPVFEDVTIKFERMSDSGRWLRVDGVYFGARYNYTNIATGFHYLGEENPILTPSEISTSVHAFECFFFIYTSIQDLADVFLLNTGYEDDLITGIAGVNANANDDAIYNIAGQRLSKTQKGVNIVGSKKILVK